MQHVASYSPRARERIGIRLVDRLCYVCVCETNQGL